MTSGRVTTTRKPLVPITILGSDGNRHLIRVVLDTGFTGYLVLPERYMRRLGLTARRYSQGRPATGEVIRIPTGRATVIWQGQSRAVEVLQLDSEPLLGMEFLWNHRITIDAVANGSVTIAPLTGYMEAHKMAEPGLTGVEISALGKMIYRKKIRPLLTEADIGKFVVIDVDSGDYEIADRDLVATRRLKERKPDACSYAVRVGYSAAYFLGWHEEPEL